MLDNTISPYVLQIDENDYVLLDPETVKACILYIAKHGNSHTLRNAQWLIPCRRVAAIDGPAIATLAEDAYISIDGGGWVADRAKEILSDEPRSNVFNVFFAMVQAAIEYKGLVDHDKQQLYFHHTETELQKLLDDPNLEDSWEESFHYDRLTVL